MTIPSEAPHHASDRDISSDAPGDIVATAEPASDDSSDGKPSEEADWTGERDTTGGQSGGLLASAAEKELNEPHLVGVTLSISKADPGETAASSADQHAESPSSPIATEATDADEAASSLDEQPAQQPAEQGAVAESSPGAAATAAREGSHARDAVITADHEETRAQLEPEVESQAVAQPNEDAAASPPSFMQHTPLEDSAPDGEETGRCEDDLTARSASDSGQEIAAADSFLQHLSAPDVISAPLPESDTDDQQTGQQAETPLAEESFKYTPPATATEAVEAAVSENATEEATGSAPSDESDSSEIGQCPPEASITAEDIPNSADEVAIMICSEAEQGSEDTATTLPGQTGSMLPDQAISLQGPSNTKVSFFRSTSDGAVQQDAVIPDPDANGIVEQPGHEASELFEEPSEDVQSPAQAVDGITCDAAECFQPSR